MQSFLPITALVAIILFAVKEIVEYVKKTRGNHRKIQAIKEILSEELERNLWTYKIMERTVKESMEILENCRNPAFGIRRTATGEIRFWRKYDENEELEGSGHPLPEVKQDKYESVVLELAQLDSGLFNSARIAYDSLKELGHIRKSLIETLDGPENDGKGGIWEGFLTYARRELKDIYDAMNELYTLMKGQPLDRPRLR